jgi:hypothetical protein
VLGLYGSGTLDVAAGGVIMRTNGVSAIDAALNNTITVSGGLVFARGAGATMNTVINRTPTVSGGGAVIVFTGNATTQYLYQNGMTTNIISNPAGSAVWANQNGKSGISYTGGAGFIEISNVTVGLYSANNWNEFWTAWNTALADTDPNPVIWVTGRLEVPNAFITLDGGTRNITVMRDPSFGIGINDMFRVRHGARFTLKNYTLCTQSTCMCLVWISKQTAFIPPYSITDWF